MPIQIKLTRTKGDVKAVDVEYVSVLDSGVLEFQEAGSASITYLAIRIVARRRGARGRPR